LDLPLTTTVIELHNYLNSILENTESLPYNFYFNSIEIKKSLNEFIKKLENFSSEKVFPITYHPQALFFVRPITRWSSSLEGHTDAVRFIVKGFMCLVFARWKSLCEWIRRFYN